VPLILAQNLNTLLASRQLSRAAVGAKRVWANGLDQRHRVGNMDGKKAEDLKDGGMGLC
jgi:hypothetical protein